MSLYGESMLQFGITLIIIAAIITVLSLTVHFIRANALKKQLEAEYGKKE